MLLRLATGLASGAIGTAAMDASQTTVIPAVGAWVESLRSGNGEDDAHPPQASADETLSSPEKVAKRGAALLGIELDREQVAAWGNRVHWWHGIQLGVPYQMLQPKSSITSGLIYGAALWLLSDELMLWALGVANAPTTYPLKVHLDALAAHCVYGAVVAIAARGLSRT
jgi:uncharacterized membrane protein YagU involved in acid resistance